MKTDEEIIKKMTINEDIRQGKTACGRSFGVVDVQPEPKNKLGFRSKPIYVKLDKVYDDLVGALLEGGDLLFYVDDVNEEGGFTKLYLFANDRSDYVRRENFPTKLLEIC